ncbi:hypothetical protein RN001_001175 [Aquatica leii]|uniref:ZP domain-containing protein n=1 Tax=Aquatica leii TaxID=1421715 RepID=A0AAN7PFS1_9COLE|nr:hypothetical protein RN001_001175 [Aquatica leii]
MFCVVAVFYILGLITGSTAKVEPKVECTSNTMRIELPITSMTKSIYLHGLKDYPKFACKPQIDETSSLAVFQLNLTNFYECGITRVINHLTDKIVYYKTIVIDYDSKIQQEELVKVKCSILPLNHTVTKRNVLPAGFEEPQDLMITNSITTHAPVPVLGVGVRQGGKLVTGELNVSPGTPLQMEIFLDKNSSVIYGLLVTHMQVTDTNTQEETIIYNGCTVDPFLFENFNTVDGDFLTAKFKAFKFPESTYVQFKCTVNVCLDKCQGVECSDGQIGYGRKRREIPSLPADPNKIFEITITSFIKVNYDDESENFESLFKNQTKIYNNKKFIVGNEMDKRFYKTVEESPSNLEIMKLMEEEKITSVIADNSAVRNSAMFVLLMGIILRLLL